MTDTNIAHALTVTELDALATTALELWDHADRERADEYLSSAQMAVLAKARAVYDAEQDGITVYTPPVVEAAFLRALAAADVFAGDDTALDIMTARGVLNLLGAGAVVTREEAVSAFNSLAEDAKAEYNPDGQETGDSVRSDSCGDLVVNLAGGYLDDPEAEAYDIIAAAWKDLDLPGGPSEPGKERDAAIVAEVRSWF